MPSNDTAETPSLRLKTTTADLTASADITSLLNARRVQTKLVMSSKEWCRTCEDSERSVMTSEEKDNRPIYLAPRKRMPFLVWLTRKIAKRKGEDPVEFVEVKLLEKLAEEDAEA